MSSAYEPDLRDLIFTVYDHTAVRITHKPTGVTTTIHDEHAGQFRNREAAMDELKGLLSFNERSAP